MHDLRSHSTRRKAGVAHALALGLAGTCFAGRAHAGGPPAPAVPPYAPQPPGASYEGYPAVGRAQVAAIAREIIHASADALVNEPLCSATQLTGRTIERLAVRTREIAPGPFLAPLDRDCGAHAPGDLGGAFGGPPTPVRLSLLPSSEGSIRALLGLIATAQRRIDLMMYGWEDDPTGREVAGALAARARQGVRVRLLVDRTAYLIHNAPAARDECTFIDVLRTIPNVHVIMPAGALCRFDHRKLAVIDDRIAWSGGMILTEVARRRWHNFAFLAEGPIVAQYAGLFQERWCEQGGRSEALNPYQAGPPIAPNATARMIRTDICNRSLKEAIYHAVDHAQRQIYLENPYFSDEILTDKLVAARRRGVDVRAVLTLRGNVERLNRYETLTANRLLHGGVRVYLFPAMTHVKALSADGVWAYVGTGNFDELSLRNNPEVGLSVTSPEVVGALDQALFHPDMAVSQELTAPLPGPRHRLLLELFALWY